MCNIILLLVFRNYVYTLYSFKVSVAVLLMLFIKFYLLTAA